MVGPNSEGGFVIYTGGDMSPLEGANSHFGSLLGSFASLAFPGDGYGEDSSFPISTARPTVPFSRLNGSCYLLYINCSEL